MKRLVTVILVMICAVWAQAKPPVRILFVGNSLTFMPDWHQPTVPLYVQKLLDSKHQSVQIDMVLHGGYTLANHWVNGEFQQKMAANQYDFVIIQPYSIEALELPECFQQFGPHGDDGPKGRASFLEYAEKMIEMARANGATPLVFEPWIYDEGHAWLQSDFKCLKFPGTDKTWYGGSRAELQKRLHDGYAALKELMAAKYNYRLDVVHIGDLWTSVRKHPNRDLSISMLYQTDHFHPTYYGSLLSALEIVEHMTGIPATQFDYEPEKMTESQVDYLEEVSASKN